MILVDSSVWIDYFNGRISEETDLLDDLLTRDSVCLGDVILSEVLQGFRSDSDYRQAKTLLEVLPIYQILSPELAIKSADNYRKLRKKGLTIRKTVDVWIATYCIEKKVPLLFSDRDFVPFIQHLKLASPIKYT